MMQIISNCSNRYFYMVIADNEHLHSAKDLCIFYLVKNIMGQFDNLNEECATLLESHKLFSAANFANYLCKKLYSRTYRSLQRTTLVVYRLTKFSAITIYYDMIRL